jgi:hypothetical protein
MSAERSPRGRTGASTDLAYRRPEMTQLRARRSAARRRRRLARVDLGIGVFVALVLLLASAGLAIAGLIAFAALLACGASVLIERRRARAGTAAPRSPRRAAMAFVRGRRAPEPAARDRTRAPR